MRGIITSFEHRAAGAGTGAGALRRWARASAALSATDDDAPLLAARAVLANALALIHFPEPRDVDDLARLVAQHGGSPVARLQESGLAAIDPGERPLTTHLVRVLAGYAWGGPGTQLRPDGRTEREELAGACVVRLLLVGDASGPPPPITDANDLRAVFEDHALPAWRAVVAARVGDPWDGTAERHLGLLDPVSQPFEVASIRAVVELSRREAEEDERRAVASHIRSTIDQTGLTQREFAALVGTSPSRLSTYVTGTVTPSAAMLLRINRAARRAQRADRARDRDRDPDLGVPEPGR
ncbi:helix-turn-helix transcriptional regulator [Pimelobacter simplex]|uniref:Helix-turn-helix transcriptional regulator n=1 Tax=Nocardioides simplex TaxID=2045 RepID=A0A7J5DUA9_NOCSI|nr:helix-turn-helix transcriptional regulator [Pimelobacter simplex]KAB2808907.1 helix-turn-helix transcriptional regulator [Pimelobacter simplex]